MDGLLYQCLWSVGLMVMSAVSTATGLYDYDVVTMRNGDIHQGAVAQEMFTLELPYGRVSIPYAHMSALQPAADGSVDRIVTRHGEVFNGRLVEREVTMLRVLDASLPLMVSDIADADFAPGRLRTRPRPAPDAIETRFGDRFNGTVIGRDMLLKTADGISIVEYEKLALMDLADLDDGGPIRAQLTLHDGGILQGELVLDAVQVETRYGQSLEIPIDMLATLAIATNDPDNARDFHHHLTPVGKERFRDRLVDGSSGPWLVPLEGGSFMRGDAMGDDDERPPSEVVVRPFAIGLFEVTFDEYDRFCDETGRSRPDDQGWGRGRRPVINVSWEDAVAYPRWLSGKSRHNYRLPTDAEWEFAARAGSTTRYWWGDEVGQARANCEGCGSLWDGEKTALVGRFPANPFALHDTAGNVFEWVADCWHDRFAEAPDDGSALDKPGCGKRVIRGGAWSFPPGEIRSANRWRDFPSRRSDDTGFRVVRELDSEG